MYRGGSCICTAKPCRCDRCLHGAEGPVGNRGLIESSQLVLCVLGSQRSGKVCLENNLELKLEGRLDFVQVGKQPGQRACGGQGM